jgi:predicted HTH transcriptional regulator
MEERELDSETAAIEFKSAFNPADKGEFLEILKDIAAMANSGGGTIVFGLLNDGAPSGADLTAVASLDPAKSRFEIRLPVQPMVHSLISFVLFISFMIICD